MGRYLSCLALALLLGCGRSAPEERQTPERRAPAGEPSRGAEPPAELSPVDPEREPRRPAPAPAEEVQPTPSPTAPPAAEEAESRDEEPEATGGRCPSGTCVVREARGCERPTGQLGNGCCRCGDDGRCATYCRCNGPGVPVDTPDGPRPIAELEVGDRVYTLEDGVRTVAPVCAIARRSAPADGFVRVTLADGRSFVTSAVHPLADGRAAWELSPADGVRSVTPAQAPSAATYDVRPATSGGVYLVAGIAFASTLRTGDRCP